MPYQTSAIRLPAGQTLLDQTLLIDADDTLWENNIYFEQAIASFVSYLDHKVHTPQEVRTHLNACERRTIAAHGYGLKSFRKSLIECFEELAEAPMTAEKHARIVSFVQAIADAEIELRPGVAETLPLLAARHRCILVTKGDDSEQRDKLERSGLARHFAAVEVLSEKNEAAYRRIAAQHTCEPAKTWMIGNSPKSDINPALAAGLNAVFLFHHSTWALEHEELGAAPEGQRLLELEGFGELGRWF
jgi:putative hydrolase of the HAD superfamily